MGNSLRKASISGDIKTVKRKISNGSDLNKKSKYGNTPLHWAALHGRTKVIAELVDNGANLNQLNDVNYSKNI
jgi:ankyrin repeat protein